MVEYNYSNYLINQIKTIGESDLPENGDFRLAIHELYLSKNSKKLGELTDTLAHYYFKKEKPKN